VLEILGVAFAVVLERVLVLVVLPAVAFDDDVVIGEVRVDLPAADVDVDLWGREGVLGDKGSKGERVGLVGLLSVKGLSSLVPGW
jgi:hypothetical protein